MRQSNAIDFWRGLALVMIYIDHVPGNVFADYTLRNFAVSDAAELFVFLAGWSLSYATGSPAAPEPAAHVTFRLVSRSLQLYRAQLVITFLALAILAAAALLLQNPLYLEWSDAGLAFYDPVHTLPGLALMTHQLAYFNILPLYIVLLLMAPAFVTVARRSPVLALALSLMLYATALLTGLSLPSWPAENQWYLNPLSWQLLLVLGFASANEARRSDAFGAFVGRLFPAAVVIVAVCAAITMLRLWPDPMKVPEPRLLFLFDKTFLSPARIISLLAIAIAFQRMYPIIEASLGAARDWLCKLGRNSLPVFAVSSLLALIGQLVRFMSDGDILVDIVIVLSGLVVMRLTAWFVEWRRGVSQSPPASPS